MLNERTLNKIAGVTLLETMLALAVGAVVLVGVAIYYASARQSANVTQVVADMNAIVGAYKAYIGRGNTVCGVVSGTCTPTQLSALQTRGFLPNPMNDPWGQSYQAISCSPAGSMQISIAIPGIGPPGSDNTCNAIKMVVGNSAVPIGPSDCIANPGCGFVYQI